MKQHISRAVNLPSSFVYPDKELEGEHFVCNTSDVPFGGMTMFAIKGTKEIHYILIHLAEGEWRAFEQKCTHLSCAVVYRDEVKKLNAPATMVGSVLIPVKYCKALPRVTSRS